MYNNIKISNWRQFEDININFDKHLTILTGSNGSGKTTILNILSKPLGRNMPLIGTPEKDSQTGVLKYFTDLFKIFKKNPNNPNENIIGSIMCNNIEHYLTVPSNISSTYSIGISNQVAVPGVFISSHRSNFLYKTVSKIPTKAISRNDIYSSYHKLMHDLETDSYYDRNTVSPTLLIKESLISLATFGYGNQVVEKNSLAIELYEGYENILKKVLPKSLGFKKFKIEVPEVLLETDSGTFSLDAVSGGIASIIELTWQIYMFGPLDENFVILLDEPENHLHPELQRTFLPNLLNAFPNVQFIVATHNPFVISSVDESQVYVLKYNDNHKVISYKLDQIKKNGTANDILRDVLGIEATMPIWAANKLQEIIEKYRSLDLNQENIDLLRNELIHEGFDNIIPKAIIDVMEENKNHD